MLPAADSSQESRRVGQILAPLLELFAEYGVLGALTGSVLLARKRTSFFHWSYGLLCAPEAVGRL